MLSGITLRAALTLTAFAGLASAQYPVITSVVNSASRDGRLAPGTLAEVTGNSFGSPDPGPVTGAKVGDLDAKVISATNTKWVILIPDNLQPGSTSVAIRSSPLFPITLTAYAPALYSADGTGTGFVNAWGFRTNSSGVPITPGYQITPSTPAKLGDIMILNATGLGPVDDLGDTLERPIVTMAGQQVLMMWATRKTDEVDCYGPCTVGMYQVMIYLPESLPVRDQQVTVTIGGANSQTLTIPISQTPIVKGVVNGASFNAQSPLVPASLVSVFGSTFGLSDQLTGFPATDFNGVSVSFNGTKAPMLALVATAGQINVQVPAELPETGQVTLKVTTPEGSSSDFPIQMAPTAPGVFVIPSTEIRSRRNAAVLMGGTAWRVMPEALAQEYHLPVNCRASGIAVGELCGEPARRGDTIQIYATGLGKAFPDGDSTKPGLATGQLAPLTTLYWTAWKPTVTIDGIPANVTFYGLAPGFAGLYQINVEVPSAARTGNDVPLSVIMPNGLKDESTTIAIRQ